MVLFFSFATVVLLLSQFSFWKHVDKKSDVVG